MTVFQNWVLVVAIIAVAFGYDYLTNEIEDLRNAVATCQVL